MSDALERLKKIGEQKIYEDTHIPVGHVHAILYESFDGLSKVQFIGFVSILEREYGEDLSGVRDRAEGYYDEINVADEAITDDTIFKAGGTKKNTTLIYILIAIVLFVVAIFYTMQSANENLQSAKKESTVVKEAQKVVLTDDNISERNSSDTNLTTIIERNTTLPVKTPEPKAVTHSLEIVARTKVWLGYINVATDQKYQKTFVGSFELDPQKEWLLYFGHGYIDVIIDGKKEKFNTKNTLRLHYENGKLEKISLEEFKQLNRGNSW